MNEDTFILRVAVWSSLPKLVWDKPSLLIVPEDYGPCVYRIWAWPTEAAVPGRLVYVGATIEPRRRMLAHFRTPWMTAMGPGVVTLQHFRNTTAMARAERAAVINEEPQACGVVRRHGEWHAQAYRSAGRG